MNIVFNPKHHVSLQSALKKLHEMNWRESLPVMEFHHPPNFFLNSCSHSRISESPLGFPRSVVVSFLFVCGISLAWISSGFPDLSSTNSDTGTGEMSLLCASSLSRTEITPTVGEKGEDEEDEEE